MRDQSFVSLQREPVYHENNADAGSVSSLSEEMEQSRQDSEHDVPSNPSVQKYEHESSGYQNPFGLLVKEHTQETNAEGISFPTIREFKRFVETMKSSFLRPGSDMSSHFQTARQMMENEIASNAENTEKEPDTSYRFNSAKEGTAYDDARENEFWSEPMNAAFEQSEQEANYQIPSESLSVPDPVYSTESLISTSVYDNQDSGLGSALYPHHHLAATEHVLSNYGSFDAAGTSGENPDVFTSAPHVQNEDFQSTSYMLHEQSPSGSFFGEDLSFSSHVTAFPVNPPNSPSQDFNITPLTTEKNIQQPEYTSHSEDTSTGYQKPSGGSELGKDFQNEEQGSVLSAPMPPSSYGNSVYVSAPRRQHYIPEYQPKHRDRPAFSFQAYQPTVGKKPKDKNYTPTAHLPASTGSVSSSSDDPSSQSSSGHVGVQTSSPHDAQDQVFNRKKPVRFHPVKPPSSLQGSNGHNSYLRDQTVSVSRPFMLNTHTKDEKQNLVSSTQEAKQMAHNPFIPVSSGSGLTQSGIPSQVGDAIFNTITNSAPTSASDRAFSRLAGNEIMSRKFGIKNIISDIRGARNLLGSFLTPRRRGIFLNGGYVSKPLSASKVSASTLSGVFWRNSGNTKRLPPQTGPNMSPPPAYIVQSRNGFMRSKVSLSNTHYAPYQLDGYKNTVSRNVKGFYEQ
ncbi:hypothetical protein ABVT39_020937 [Epinephelus coioides]